jgi:hypothetical protein
LTKEKPLPRTNFKSETNNKVPVTCKKSGQSKVR